MNIDPGLVKKADRARLEHLRGFTMNDYDYSVMHSTVEVESVEAALAAVADDLRAEGAEQALNERLPCDGGCSYGAGPMEHCSRHGRPVSEVWRIVEDLITKGDWRATTCTCTWYTTTSPHEPPDVEYEPNCPEHSDHLWDPRAQMWVPRSDLHAEGVQRALREAADELAVLNASGDRHSVGHWLRARADKYRDDQ